jgi:hypothetical protein
MCSYSFVESDFLFYDLNVSHLFEFLSLENFTF